MPFVQSFPRICSRFFIAAITVSLPPLALAAAQPSQTPPSATKSTAISNTITAEYGNLPLSFEANQGQASSSIQFLSHGQGYILALESTNAILHLQNPVVADPAASVTLHLVGARSGVVAIPEDRQITQSNYFLGNDPRSWHTNIPNYSHVRYTGIYPGIDLVYYGNHRSLEHDFIVAPGANPEKIALSIKGASKLIIDPKTGDLIIATNSGDIRLLKPFSYQPAEKTGGPRQQVQSSYKLMANNKVAFSIGRYNSARSLIIDPVLIYSTYLGGSGSSGSGDQGNGIAVDSSGNAYIIGTTFSTNFPVTFNAFQKTSSAASQLSNVFVSKLNASGTALIYSTYLGGSGGDAGYGIALDSLNNTYITGTTYSTDFPITCGAFQTASPSITAGASTGFVTKLNPTGSALDYSTYLGGKGNLTTSAHGDIAQAIAVSASGNAYVTGYTWSSNFPVTDKVVQPDFAGSASASNAFVTELNAAGTALTYSTFLGGSGGDYGNAIALDPAGDAFVAGNTGSPNFPVTSGALQSSKTGASNAFVTKLNPTGTDLLYSTYFGGTGGDSAGAIAVDSQGFAYVGGETGSADLPITAGVLEGPDYGGNLVYLGGFVFKLNQAGTSLEYSTHLQGHGTTVTGLAVDSSGTAYVTGSTAVPGAGGFGGFQSTPGALAVPTSSSAAYLVKLDPAASVLNYATFIGGSNTDGAMALALDTSGNAYITGYANSTDFPTTTGVLQPHNKSTSAGSNAFVSKLALASEINTTPYPPFPTDLGTYIVVNSAVVNYACYIPAWAINVDVTVHSNQLGPPLTGFATLSGSFAYGITYQVQGDWGTTGAEVPLTGGGGIPDGSFTVDYYNDPIYSSSTLSGTAGFAPTCDQVVVSGPTRGTARSSSSTLSGNGKVNLTVHQDSAETRAKNVKLAEPKFTLPLSAPVNESRLSAATQTTAACIAPQQTALVVTLHNAARVYGAANPTFTYNVSGLLSGDTVTVSPSTTATSRSPAGIYPITATVNGSTLANYVLVLTNATLYVQKATLRVQPQTIGATYGGPVPIPTVYEITGFVNGDTQASAITGTPQFHYDVPVGSPVGQYPLTLTQGTLASTNYSFWFFPYTVQIFKAPLTGTIQNATIHKGDPIPNFTFTWSGFVNGDTAATAVTGAPILSTTATSSSPVGRYLITGALGTLHSNNYGFIPVNGTLIILP